MTNKLSLANVVTTVIVSQGIAPLVAAGTGMIGSMTLAIIAAGMGDIMVRTTMAPVHILMVQPHIIDPVPTTARVINTTKAAFACNSSRQSSSC
jgi:hypothetical protein